MGFLFFLGKITPAENLESSTSPLISFGEAIQKCAPILRPDGLDHGHNLSNPLFMKLSDIEPVSARGGNERFDELVLTYAPFLPKL